jgi:hypothetical protein
MTVPQVDFRRGAFLEWLVTPLRDRVAKTQAEFAASVGLDPNQLSTWKKDPEFLREWEAKYLSTIGSPERKMSVLDTLYRTATDPDDPRHVQAAKQYMELAEGLRPQKIDISLTKSARNMSDEELDSVIQGLAQRELNQRKAS